MRGQKIGWAWFLLLASLAAGQTARSARETALALEQQGRYAEAEAAWQQWLPTHAASAEAYAHLGYLEARQQRPVEAVAWYRKAMALRPAIPGLQLNLGLALFKSGDLKGMVKVFVPLLKSLPPSSPDAQRVTTLLGIAYYGLGEHASAVLYLKKAAAQDPQNPHIRLLLTHSCLATKQFSCVLDVYHEILTLNAESAEADMLAGEAMDEMQNHEGAIEQFRAAVKADPKEPNVHFGLGYLLWKGNHLEEAAQEFQAELANVPDNAQALAYLADCDVQLNRPAEALPLAERAVRIDSGIERAHLDLGILYNEAGRLKEALVELRQATQLNPKDADVHWKLARLYQAVGDKKAAAIEFDQTRTLKKAADDTIFQKLKKAQDQGKSLEAASASAQP